MVRSLFVFGGHGGSSEDVYIWKGLHLTIEGRVEEGVYESVWVHCHSHICVDVGIDGEIGIDAGHDVWQGLFACDTVRGRMWMGQGSRRRGSVRGPRRFRLGCRCVHD